MDGYILSIDQGTSGTKATIFNHSGSIVASAFHEVVQFYPQSGWVEQDANEIWTKTIQAVAEVLKNARILPEDIKAIGISNQRCTAVVWNKTTGEPIGRAIIWQDRRSQQICNQMAIPEREAIALHTGFFPIPNLSCTKIKWLLTEDRTVQKALSKGELLFGTIDSWLIWKLSGREFHITDRSNASTTGLLNAVGLEYDDWVMDYFGVPREILPDLVDSSEIRAWTDPTIFFGIRIPISGVMGDQPAAVFGQACHHYGMIKNTYGTGAFMILNTGERHLPPKNGVISPVLWTIKDQVAYGLEGYTDVSGAVLNWLCDGLQIFNDIKDADGLAMQVTDTQGVYFVPAMVGLNAPHFSPQARGTIVGINLGTARSHIVRAAVESMAYQTRDALSSIEKAMNYSVKSLRVDGGGATSDFLLQFQADILGIPVERPVVVETSAQGAAYAAGLAIGYWQSMEEIESNWKLETRFEPRMSETRREALYDGWLEAVDTAKYWGAKKNSSSSKTLLQKRKKKGINRGKR